jgi:predicted RNA binding protein YcfA (HicA-like mRNA interferase family)
MGRYEDLVHRILGGRADANISFDDLCGLLRHLGFEERQRGSHHIFRREGIEERINLQREGKHAKVYQVRQVRSVLLRYRLEGEG